MVKILVLYGFNFNLLGVCELDIYGCEMLVDINGVLVEQVQVVGYELSWYQFNVEYELIGCIYQVCDDQMVMIVFNFGVFIYISIVLCDVLVVVIIFFIEVYLFNVYVCELFCWYLYLVDIVVGVICGFGSDSYWFVLDVVICCLV